MSDAFNQDAGSNPAPAPAPAPVSDPNQLIHVTVSITRNSQNGWMQKDAQNRSPRAIGEIIAVEDENGNPVKPLVYHVYEAAKEVFPGQDDFFYTNMTPAQQAHVIRTKDLKPVEFEAEFYGTNVPNFKAAVHSFGPEVAQGFSLTGDVDLDELSMVKLLNQLYRQSGTGVAEVTFAAKRLVSTITVLTVNGQARTSCLLEAKSLKAVRPAMTGSTMGVLTSSTDAAVQAASGLGQWRRSLASAATSTRVKPRTTEVHEGEVIDTEKAAQVEELEDVIPGV